MPSSMPSLPAPPGFRPAVGGGNISPGRASISAPLTAMPCAGCRTHGSDGFALAMARE